jgi:hypothetical protein
MDHGFDLFARFEFLAAGAIHQGDQEASEQQR